MISALDKIVDPTARENTDFSSVRCSDCRYSKPATATDPWSWHLCEVEAIREHGWGMAPRRCERWEATPWSVATLAAGIDDAGEQGEDTRADRSATALYQINQARAGKVPSPFQLC